MSSSQDVLVAIAKISSAVETLEKNDAKLERRVARIEMAIVATLLGTAYITIQLMLKQLGLN